MMYICQDAYPKKVIKLNICSYLINFEWRDYKCKLFAITEIKNIKTDSKNTKTDASKNDVKSALGKISLCI